MLAATAIGIDVSDGTLKAVELARRGRRLSLRRAWREPYYLRDPDPMRGGVAAAAAFVHRARPGARPRVVVSAPTRGAFSTTYLIPTMQADRIEEMVRYEVLHELEQAAEDLLVRHHVRKGVEECQVHAYALRRADVEAFRRDLADAGVSYDALETPGYALASLVELEMPRGGDRILLGVGEVATELVLMTERGLWTRHVPLGLADGDDPLALARRFRREIDAAVSTLLPSDRPFAPHDLVLTEEGALDARFTGELKRTLGLAVTRTTTLQRIATPARLEADGQTPEQALSMAKAMGLALAGLGLGRFRCPVVAGSARRETLRLMPAAAAAAIVSAGGLLALGAAAQLRLSELDAALPPTLAAEWNGLARAHAAASAERDARAAASDALLSLAAARPAVFAPKRALVQAARVLAQPAFAEARVEAAYLAAPTPERRGVLTLVASEAAPGPADLGAQLEQALRNEFGTVRRRSAPVSAPGEALRHTLEVELP